MAAVPRVGPSHRRVRWRGDLLFVTQSRAPAHQAGRVLGARTIANVTVPAIGDRYGCVSLRAFWGTPTLSIKVVIALSEALHRACVCTG
jgi:hypothetical protein